MKAKDGFVVVKRLNIAIVMLCLVIGAAIGLLVLTIISPDFTVSKTEACNAEILKKAQFQVIHNFF